MDGQLFQKKNEESLFNLSFFVLLFISTIIAIGFNMVYTIISKYAVEGGASLSSAGVIAGVFSIAALAVRPFSGLLADIWNKRVLCIISTGVIAVSSVGYALSNSMGFLIFFRVLHGAAFGISSTTLIALAATIIPSERIAEGIGYLGLGQVIAQIIGPYFGVLVVAKWGYPFLFLGAAIMSFVASMLYFLVDSSKASAGRLLDKGLSKRKITFDSLIAREALFLASISGVFSFGNGIVNSFLILIGQQRHVSNIELFFSVSAISLFVFRLFVGRLADRKELKILVNIALIFSAVSMLLIGYSSCLYLFLLAAILKSVGQAGGQVSIQAECVKKAGTEREGVATSTYYIFADIGQGIGPILGGFISDLAGYRVMFYITAFLFLINFLIFNLGSLRKKIRS